MHKNGARGRRLFHRAIQFSYKSLSLFWFAAAFPNL